MQSSEITNQIAEVQIAQRLFDFWKLTLERIGQSLIGLFQSLRYGAQLLADAVYDFRELVQSLCHFLVGHEELILCGAIPSALKTVYLRTEILKNLSDLTCFVGKVGRSGSQCFSKNISTEGLVYGACLQDNILVFFTKKSRGF